MKKLMTWAGLMFSLATLAPAAVSANELNPSPVPIASTASATSAIQLFLDGKPLLTEVPPIIKNGSTLVPVRVIAEALGSEVKWNNELRQVTVNKLTTTIQLTIDSEKAVVNNQPVQLDAAPMIEAGTTLLPVRFVSEQFGMKVKWDDFTRSVFLYQNADAQEAGPDELDESEDAVNAIAGEAEDKSDADKGEAANQALVSTMKAACPVAAQPVAALSEEGESGQPADSQQVLESSVSTAADKAEATVRNLVADTAAVAASNGVSDSNSSIVAAETSSNGVGVPESNLEGASSNEGSSSENPKENSKENRASSVKAAAAPLVFKGVVIYGDCIAVQVEGGTAAPETFTLTAPDRIVIDLPNTILDKTLEPGAGGQAVHILENGRYAGAIRYSLFSNEPKVVRIVIDLAEKAPFQFVESEQSGMLIGVFGAMPSAGSKKDKFRVVIDPGHGGKDSGATSASGYYEKELVLKIGLKVHELLQKVEGVEAILTRPDDTFVELADRAAIANEADADLFVSIHANALDKSSIRGTETFYWTEQSQAFAQVMHKHLIQATKFPDRKVKQGNFHVIRNTKMPSVLLELGFLTNKAEEAAMYEAGFVDRVAAAIVTGIKEQLNLK